jgi:hypothetical protein
MGTAEGCGTEFLDGFSGVSSGSKRVSQKDQFVDSAPDERASELRGGGRLGVRLRHAGIWR